MCARCSCAREGRSRSWRRSFAVAFLPLSPDSRSASRTCTPRTSASSPTTCQLGVRTAQELFRRFARPWLPSRPRAVRDTARGRARRRRARALPPLRRHRHASPISTAPPTRAREKQLDLSRLLVEELRALGIADARLTEHGYVFATLPGTVAGAGRRAARARRHDPGTPGAGVSPIVHRAYDGSPIVLPGDASQVIDPAETPELAARVGHDIVTSDGDNAARGGRQGRRGRDHGRCRLAGRAIPRCRARAGPRRLHGRRGDRPRDGLLRPRRVRRRSRLHARRLGCRRRSRWSRSRPRRSRSGSAAAARTRARAKGKLVNSLKLAAELSRRCRARRSHPRRPTVARASSIRRASAARREETVDQLHRARPRRRQARRARRARAAARGRHRRGASRARASRWMSSSSIRTCATRSTEHPRVVEVAVEAYRRVGVEPVFEPIRGGTDGSRLSAAGLPTPNLFTGGQDYHSLREWASVQDMAAAAAMIVELAGIWARPVA